MLPIYIRTTPIILLFILAVTVVPNGFRMPSVDSITLTFEPWEFGANLALFIPLGLALRGLTLSQAVPRGAALATAVEAMQFFQEGRYPQPTDVIANTLGALCGAAAGRWLGLRFGWRLDRIPPGRVTALCAALPLIAFGVVFHQRASLWTWDPSYKLAVGDELTRNRAWQGDIFEIAIFNVPLDPAVFSLLADEGPGSIAANRQRFPGAPVFERTTPLKLEYLRGIPLLEGSDAQRFFDSLVDAENFTVLLWCRPAKSPQFGPARIITYSLDTEVRNFTLAQSGKRVEFRVRTWISGANAIVFSSSTAPVLNGNEDVLLAASYDGQVSRIYVNGRLARERDLSDPHLFWYVSSVQFVPGILVLLGALPAISLLELTGWRDRRLRWCVAGIAGVVAGIFFLGTGGGGMHNLLGPFVVVFAPLGALAVLWGSGAWEGSECGRTLEL